MEIFIYVSFYFLAIIGAFIRIYFSRFIAIDYYNNRMLNRKRKFAIFYNYFILFYCAFILFLAKKEIVKSLIVVWSVVPIIIFYIYFLDFFVAPPNNKKKFK